MQSPKYFISVHFLVGEVEVIGLLDMGVFAKYSIGGIPVVSKS